jgi:hypothetical protein
MPILHENIDSYIYEAIVNTEKGPKYTWDENNKVYRYSNSNFPNKNHTKIFDPKLLGMSRGDVIHFGNDNYRNNNKLIYDGVKLQELWTEVDDYGSVPPTFLCGDGPGDFNIGDFEDIIENSTINWLSKEKLKEIEIVKNKDEVYGKVQIKGKKWIITIDNINMVSNSIDDKFNCVKQYINKLIDNYDDINKRHPIINEGENLAIYM